MRTLALIILGCAGLAIQVPDVHAQARQAGPARPAATIIVTDMEGKPLADVRVKATGPVDREAATDADGTVTLRNMTAGTYRLRFDHDDHVLFEREVTVQAGRALKATVSLAAAPAPPPPPPAPEPEPPPAGRTLPPAGPPTFVSIPDFVAKNFVGNAPSMTSLMGCAPSATSNLLQLRDPLAQHTHDEADEMLYIVAGEGTHRIGGREIPLSAGVFAVVPRGIPHSIARRGSRPIIVLSILSDQPCEQVK